MWEEIALWAALIVCALLLLRMRHNRGGDSRSARLMKKYKTLTPDLLAETADEELVEAVVAHVLAEAADSRRPDPAYVLSKWPQPFMVVYSIWAVCKELAHGDYAALKRTATREMVEPACDSLPVVGASKTAAALKVLAQAHQAGEDTAEAETAFHQAVEEECPLSLCVAYIRDHVPALTGTEEPVSEDTAAIGEETTDAIIEETTDGE